MNAANTKPYTVLLFGTTGLLGREVLRQALINKTNSPLLLKSFSRTEIGSIHDPSQRLEKKICDFKQITTWPSENFQGDCLFLSLGTTRSKAGSLEQQRIVDVTYPLEIAQRAKAMGVKKCIVISSQGASLRSFFPYFKMKGELEEGIKKINFVETHLIRPSLLLGKRNHFRPLETIGGKVLQAVTRAPFMVNFRPHEIPILASQLCTLILNPQSNPGLWTYEASMIHQMSSAES